VNAPEHTVYVEVVELMPNSTLRVLYSGDNAEVGKGFLQSALLRGSYHVRLTVDAKPNQAQPLARAACAATVTVLTVDAKPNQALARAA
jgi:hypothetical protein